MENVALSYEQGIKLVKTQWDCINYGGEWVTPNLNYDNVFQSMLTLATIQTTEGWTSVLWDTVDSVKPYHQPIRNNSPVTSLLTMVMIVVICLLFYNLFVGVVIETYMIENRVMSKNHLLTKSQKTWL